LALESVAARDASELKDNKITAGRMTTMVAHERARNFAK
jgi:hypothetical protein